MHLKNSFFTLVLSFPTLISAQTLRVVQLPPNQSVVSLGNNPSIEYLLSPSGDAMAITQIRFGIYPLWPLTVDDIGKIKLTRGDGSVLAQKVPTKRNASALDLTISSGFSVRNLGEEALFFSIAPQLGRPGRPDGIVVVKLEEIVGVGEKTKATEVILGNERFTVAIRLPATELRPAIQREGVPPNEILTIRFPTELEKTYQLETGTLFSKWSPVSNTVSGTGAEARIALSVTYDKLPHFFRVAVMPKVSTSVPPPVVLPPPVVPQPPPTQPTPPPPSPSPSPASGPVGFGYSGKPKPEQPIFGYP